MINSRINVFRLLSVTLISLILGCQQKQLPLSLDAGFSEWESKIFGPTSVEEEVLPVLKADLKEAQEIVADFYNSDLISNPPIIYLHTAEQFQTYGSQVPFIAMNKITDDNYILLNGSRAPDENAIAHELSHIEYYQRVGPSADEQTPVWFKEGMTLQLDRSGRFAMDSLLQYGFSLDSLPDVTHFANMDELIDAPRPEIFRRLRIAHYMFAQWYTEDRLNELMDRLRNGEPFEEVFQDLSVDN